MYVYFVKCSGENPLIKIGKAKNPIERIRVLQTGSPYKLKLLGAVKCKSDQHAKQVELFAHNLFYKQRRRGEWFRLSVNTEQAIKNVITKANADAEITESVEYAHRLMDEEYQAIMGSLR